LTPPLHREAVVAEAFQVRRPYVGQFVVLEQAVLQGDFQLGKGSLDAGLGSVEGARLMVLETRCTGRAHGRSDRGGHQHPHHGEHEQSGDQRQAAPAGDTPASPLCSRFKSRN